MRRERSLRSRRVVRASRPGMNVRKREGRSSERARRKEGEEQGESALEAMQSVRV